MIRKITPNDAEYPKNLRNIHTPPKQLYVNGTLLESDEMAVAIVGSRRATIYGLETSEKLGFELAARGITVVSGMAVGIDSAAHRGALKAKGRTIAVMGGGHNCIYPPQNKELYEEIAKTGAVVTEYEDDMPTLPQQFPARNRIISGLSLGVVVVEAARNSGALITANFAAEQGRTVFAVPGKVSSGTSSGKNELIKDGACLIQSVDDILDELSITEIAPAADGAREALGEKITRQTNAYIYNSLTDDERKIYKNLSDEPSYIDELLEKTGMEHSKISQVLLNLELKKLIKELPGKQFVRKESV
ncbi:MAG: DNA-processing protein DprA [Candidatus Omnitrophica bacterium]|nr:DNA-processing protein DprA [Candidatus Omnitrophota bacterium]